MQKRSKFVGFYLAGLIQILPFGLAFAEAGEESMKEAKLPACLQGLLHADKFQDSVKGEDGKYGKNFAFYLQASERLPGLQSEDLSYLLEHASPAGRVYAAVLLKQSGQIGDNLSFAKLLDDQAELVYQSGCKCANYKVSELASAFMKEGRFQNFQFSIFCKLKQKIDRK